MSDEKGLDLEPIKDRRSKVSWGEWWLHLENPRVVCGTTIHEMEIRFGDPNDDRDSFDLLDGYNEDDYRFIAHAKRDIGSLVTEVERLRSLNARLVAACEIVASCGHRETCQFSDTATESPCNCGCHAAFLAVENSPDASPIGEPEGSKAADRLSPLAAEMVSGLDAFAGHLESGKPVDEWRGLGASLKMQRGRFVARVWPDKDDCVAWTISESEDGAAWIKASGAEETEAEARKAAEIELRRLSGSKA